MRILFITSAHNSLSQRLQVELVDRGHTVAVHLAATDEGMRAAVTEHRPDLILAPMLKRAIPPAIWGRHTCLIVHPGIKGDRGPSSLDWAILREESSWGVTVLQAVAEMDAGPIWATVEFPPPSRPISKSSLYRTAVTEAAVTAVLLAVERYERGGFEPEPLDDCCADVRGACRPAMKQADRSIDWSNDSTARIVRRIRAADTNPGVLDATLFGDEMYLYGAHEEDHLRGAPGRLLARREGAVCVGTMDGALWMTHLKAKGPGPYAGIKLPAAQVLGRRLEGVSESPIAPTAVIRHRTYRDIVYSERRGVGYLAFDFYNGAMSTQQCCRLRKAFQQARRAGTKVIVLLGGRHFFSNGIHLNTIEAAPDPAVESWANINAMNDLVLDVLDTRSHLVVSALRGNAGAGGAMLALAADYIYARDGVVLNPHYKGMGGLYGSEYWTYTLPRRVGPSTALALTDGLMTISARSARALHFVDDVIGGNVSEFGAAVVERAEDLAARHDFERLLAAKSERRRIDEQRKPLAAYRAEELARMSETFFGPDRAYHEARRRFVRKGADATAARCSMAAAASESASTNPGRA